MSEKNDFKNNYLDDIDYSEIEIDYDEFGYDDDFEEFGDSPDGKYLNEDYYKIYENDYTDEDKYSEENIKDEKSKFMRLFNFLKPTLVVVAVTLFLTTVIFQPGRVGSGSMMNTISDNTFILGKRCPEEGCKIEHGDIVIFNHKDYEELLIKRVIGMPGDTIELKGDGELYVNGVLEVKEYLNGESNTYPLYDFPERTKYIVPNGKLFVLGDNREFSSDSRAWENPFIDIKDDLNSILVFTIDFNPVDRGFIKFH